MTKRPKPVKLKPMTADEFREIRIATGATQAQFARVLGYGHSNRVSSFESGVRAIPPQLDRLMRAYESGYRPADWPAAEIEAAEIEAVAREERRVQDEAERKVRAKAKEKADREREARRAREERERLQRATEREEHRLAMEAERNRKAKEKAERKAARAAARAKVPEAA